MTSLPIIPLALLIATLDPAPAGAAKKKSKEKPKEVCAGVSLPASGKGLPFSIGEELSYELKVGGVYVGKMDIKVGQPRMIQGKKMMTLFGRARTNTFVAQYKSFEGRYMSFVDPDTFRPAAVRVESTYGEEKRWERATFNDDITAVSSAYRFEGKEGTRTYDRDFPLFDMLSLLYYARTRALDAGTATCQEVYVDRRLWRMDSNIEGFERVSTPAGDKRAHVIHSRFERMPHPDFDPKAKRPWIEFDLYLSADESRVPLGFVARNQKVTGRGDLVSWSLRGRGGEGPWEF